MLDVLTEFASRLRDAGLDVDASTIIADGQWHRCGIIGKGRGNKSGSYTAHIDNPANVTWCNWVTGDKQTWCAKSDYEMTPQERQAFRDRIEAQRQAREQELTQQWAQAAKGAEKIWQAASPAKDDHPYLKAKDAACYGLRVTKDGRLTVPVYDDAMKLQSLQYIAGNGDKRFMPGGKMEGGCFPIVTDNGNSGPVVIAEGYATGASIHQATGFNVLVAFTASNLETVAKQAHRKQPERQIIIGADFDLPNKTHPDDGGTGVAMACNAARAVGGKVAIPPVQAPGVKIDWNDLAKDHPHHEIKELFEKSLQDPARVTNEMPYSQGATWPTPVYFEDVELPQPSPEILPPVLADFCGELTESLQVGFALPLAISMAAVATAAQGRYQVHIKPGYIEPLNLYTLCPLGPGNRKTPVVKACAKPIREYEKQCQNDLAPDIKRIASERKTLEKVIEAKRKKAAGLKDKDKLPEMIAEIAALEADLPDIPTLPCLLADNVTTERMATLMAENGEKMGILEAEGDLFNILSGQYSKGVPNIGLYLKAHDIEEIRVQRVVSGPVYLERPCLSIGMAVQPCMLAKREAAETFRGRGLDGRFLYFMAPSTIGSREVDPPAMTTATAETYSDTIKRLLATNLPLNEAGEPVPYTLPLAPDAYGLWLRFAGAIEKELATGGELEFLRDWGTKISGKVARVAGLFHLLTQYSPENAPIPVETMEKAIMLGGILVEHAKAAYGLMGCDPATENAKRVLTWLQDSPQKRLRFTTQECWQNTKRAFQEMEPLTKALTVLVARGFLREVEPERRQGPGRPAAKSYLVNQSIYEVA